ncbi:hypothetical protein RND81_05G237400 [Saponaria officinalis]|uniref:Uncharacterized protein n=1 Tax=Saponaria officinalis TaxID=3572 RepID=A0AAW1L3F5_SAPOF
MKNEEVEGSTSSSPSPPRQHPSPLPVSTGPDHEKYSFSQSSSLSPPVSPPGSSHTSAEDLCLMHAYKFENRISVSAPSSLSVDRVQPTDDSFSESTSCLRELLEWFVHRCCICCSWNLDSPSRLHQS